MVSKRPKVYHFEDLSGKNIIEKLDEVDQDMKKYHFELNNRSLLLFNEFMELYSQLVVSMYKEVPGFLPKFSRGTPIMKVVLASACGSFRCLRIAHKLLLEGYYPEMHCILRMVNQWLECSAIVEGDPKTASLIWSHGLNRKKKAIKNSIENIKNSNEELKNRLTRMKIQFQILSQRCHPLKSAFHLISLEGEKGTDFFPGGVLDEQIFANDALNLASQTLNALNNLLKHFQSVPQDWHERFSNTEREVLRNLPEKDRY